MLLKTWVTDTRLRIYWEQHWWISWLSFSNSSWGDCLWEMLGSLYAFFRMPFRGNSPNKKVYLASLWPSKYWNRLTAAAISLFSANAVSLPGCSHFQDQGTTSLHWPFICFSLQANKGSVMAKASAEKPRKHSVRIYGLWLHGLDKVFWETELLLLLFSSRS